MKPWATLKEFLITKPKTVPLSVADKLYWYHIFPMSPVREELGVSITASARSGYRPLWWERWKGRSGKSQHTFGQIDKSTFGDGKGAVDWTCKDFRLRFPDFLKLIIKHTEYTRIAIYPSFIHCDYKKTPSGKREVYNAKFDNGKFTGWEFSHYA